MKTRSRAARGLTSLTVITTLVVGSLAVSPQPTQAVEGDSCQSLISGVNQNLESLRSQSAELAAQIGEVNEEIAGYEADYQRLERESKELWDAILESMGEGWIIDSSSTPFDALVSSDSLAELFSSEHYRNKVSEDLQEKVEVYFKKQDEINDLLADAKEKRQGLLELKSQHDQRQTTMEAQEEAKQAAEQMKVEECKAAQQANEQAETEGIAQAASGGSTGSSSGEGGSFSPIGGGNNPYPFGQCTWYVYSATGRGQNGNAGTWGAASSTPGVGKIMIWRPGEQGASYAGHVGVVIGVSGSNVTIRHMNWGGAFGQVTTGTFQSTGKFY